MDSWDELRQTLAAMQSRLPTPTSIGIRVDSKMPLVFPNDDKLRCVFTRVHIQGTASHHVLGDEDTAFALQQMRQKVTATYWGILGKLNSVEHLEGRKDEEIQMALKVSLERYYMNSAQQILGAHRSAASKFGKQVSLLHLQSVGCLLMFFL